MPDAVAAPPSSPPMTVLRVAAPIRPRGSAWSSRPPPRPRGSARRAGRPGRPAPGGGSRRRRCAARRGRRARRAPGRRPSASRWAVGSSTSSTGAVDEDGAGQGERARCPADSPNPSSPSGVASPRAGSRRSPRGRRRRRASQTAWSPAPLPSTRASRRVPGGRNGRWVTRWARPARTVPAVGVRSPAASSRRVDLPTPEGPVTAVSPGPAASVDADEHRARGLRVGVGDVAEDDTDLRRARVGGRRRASASSSARMPSMASAPSAAAWNSAPTRRIGQYASGASRIATQPGLQGHRPVRRAAGRR